MEDATTDFLEKFEHPDDWESKIEERTGYAEAVLDAFKGVGIDG